MATFRRKAANRHRQRTGQRCFCSERHVRTVLRQAQEADGWSGRRSQDAESAVNYAFCHARIATQCDDGTGAGNRKAEDVLELAQLAPGELRTLLQPLWADNGKTIRPRCVFPTIARRTATTGLFARPCRAASGRAVFSGLTRFDNNTQRPIGDLAITGKPLLTGYAGTFIFVQR